MHRAGVRFLHSKHVTASSISQLRHSSDSRAVRVWLSACSFSSERPRGIEAHDGSTLRFGSNRERPCRPKGRNQRGETGKTCRRHRTRRNAWGASVHSGTIPSKTVRDAVLYLTGFNERAFYGQDYRLREQINRDEIDSRVRTIITRETHLVRSQFSRNRVAEVDGSGRFLDSHTVEITKPSGATTTVMTTS